MTNKAYEDMTDEEFLNAPVPDFATKDETEEEEGTPEAEVTVVEGATDEVTEDEVTEEEPATDDEPENEPEVQAEKVKPEAAKEPETNEQPAASINYQAEYEKLLAPFKANGQEISVKNIDEAIKLMQMGANYNKKMTGLKPSLRILKLLENQDLLDEQKLSYLIDLEKRNPEAINKLVSESGIDPLDIDAEKAKTYKPQVYSVDDKQLVFDEVLREIRDTESFGRTAQIVSKEWDSESRKEFSNEPRLLKLINNHIENGVFDVISKEVERKRMLVELTGVSDIVAYRQVGDALQASGGFDHLNIQNQTPTRVTAPKVEKPVNAALNEKRKAAAPTKAAAVQAKVRADFNPLEMSDEEFEKFDFSKLK